MSFLRLTTMASNKASAPTAIGVAAALALTLIFTAPNARANDLIVRYDQSQLIRLPRPAAEVIIGNPSIADVTIQGGNLLVVTGKTFGITNIIALDAQRNVIQDQRVLVERDDQRALVLYKGSMRESYTCTPMCAPTITIGDETKFFETMTKHALNKASVSAGSTERGAQSATQ
jgi:Flp pilus assembly secretin CpaC